MTIAVDFDGTIVTHEYPKIGRDIPFAIDTLKRLQKDFQVILVLWTVREGRWLEFYAVNANYPEENEREQQPRKLKADLFIDDRNLGGLPDWGVIYQMIASGSHLQPVPTPVHDEYPPKKKGFLQSLLGG